MQIDRMSQDPWAPRILHKVERNGCCLPAVWQDMCCGCIPLCATPKKRSYLWIMEGGVEENLACCLVFDPFTCTCCTAADHVSKDYFDNSNYKPCCQSFCGDNFKKGIATENDMNYCCFCINCVCCYDICCKPCYGGQVSIVHCPNESGCLFNIATRCCPLCCTKPKLLFVKDSKVAKEQLVAAMRASRAKVKKGAPTGSQMARH